MGDGCRHRRKYTPRPPIVRLQAKLCLLVISTHSSDYMQPYDTQLLTGLKKSLFYGYNDIGSDVWK